MSYLTKLDVVHNSVLNPNNPTHQKRIRLIDSLIEQQNMLDAMVNKQPYQKYETSYVYDAHTGEPVAKKLPIKIKQWYWAYDGMYYFQAYYRRLRLSIRDDMSVIVADNPKSLISSVGILMCAVEAGELDEQLELVCE
ncbi:MAG: hypothetical protein R8M14_01230 [Ghiorsea sp.]